MLQSANVKLPIFFLRIILRRIHRLELLLHVTTTKKDLPTFLLNKQVDFFNQIRTFLPAFITRFNTPQKCNMFQYIQYYCILLHCIVNWHLKNANVFQNKLQTEMSQKKKFISIITYLFIWEVQKYPCNTISFC